MGEAPTNRFSPFVLAVLSAASQLPKLLRHANPESLTTKYCFYLVTWLTLGRHLCIVVICVCSLLDNIFLDNGLDTNVTHVANLEY